MSCRTVGCQWWPLVFPHCMWQQPNPFCLSVLLCSLCRASAWIKGRSTWWDRQWAATWQGCTLPSTLPSCLASPWSAHLVKWRRWWFLKSFKSWGWLTDLSDVSPPGLIYPEETKFVAHLREMEKVQRDDSIPLIPSTLPELRDMLDLCCYKAPKLPGTVRTTTVIWKQKQQKASFRLESRMGCYSVPFSVCM